MGLSVFGLGAITKWEKVAKLAQTGSSVMSGGGAVKAFIDNNLTVDISAILGAGGALPFPILSVPCSVGSVVNDFGQGLYYGQ